MDAQDENPYEPPATEARTANVPTDAEFVLSGCLTVSDAMAARRLAMPWRVPGLILLLAVLGAFCVVLITIGVSSRRYSPQASNVILLVGCILLPATPVGMYLFVRLRLHRFARRRYGMFAPTRSTVSATRIVTKSENASAEIEWSAFSRFVANDSIALLFYENSNQLLILARSKLQPPADWTDLVTLVQSKLANR